MPSRRETSTVDLPGSDDSANPEPESGPERTFGQKTLGEFLWVAVPKVAAGLGQLAANLFLIRALGPESSGALFVCITAIILIDAVIGSALDVAVLKRSTSSGAAGTFASLRIQKAALTGKVLGCLALGLPLILFNRPLGALLLHRAEDGRLLILSLISVIGLLAFRSVQTYFQVSRKFVLYGTADLFQNAVKFGCVGIMVAGHFVNPVRVLLLYASVPAAASAIMLISSARRVLLAPFAWFAVKELWSDVKWYLGSAAAASTNSRMDILLLSTFAGTAQAGLFSAAQVFVMPVQLIGMYLGVVFGPRIMPLWETGRLWTVYRRFQTAVVAAAAGFYLLAFLLMEKTATALLPASYHGSTALILILMPAGLTALINFPWTISFLMFNHARFLLLFELCALPVLFLLYRFLASKYGAYGVASVTAGFALAKTVAYQLVASRTMTAGPCAVT